MRLVDADALKERFGECPYNWTDSPEEIQAELDWDIAMENINEAPTIDAIPVDYLKWRIMNAKNNGIVEAADAFEFVLKCWKEQEMNNNAAD